MFQEVTIIENYLSPNFPLPPRFTIVKLIASTKRVHFVKTSKILK